MAQRRLWIILTAAALFAACTTAPTTNTTTTTTGGVGSDTSTNGSTGSTTTSGDSLALTGQIQSAGVPRAAALTVPADEGFLVIAQSAATGELYQGTTDAAGSFQVDVPKSESGATFMVSIVKPDGRAAGPVLLEQSGDHAMTGLALTHDASLGTITVPDDPAAGPLTLGKGADAADMIAPDLQTRLDANGLPLGLLSAGKGAEAKGGSGGGPHQEKLDADQDGLPNVIDADDNGNGIVDEFDGAGDAGGILPSSGIRLNFFMNLKIDDARANVYYAGTTAEIEDALKTDTIITFEVMAEPTAAKKPVAVRVLERPGPTYLPLTEKMSSGTPQTFAPWTDTNYEFDAASDRLQAFVRPNALLTAGDTFVVLVEFDDGSKRLFARMINYVFKNIPRLQQFGASGSLTSFTGTQPIEFDGAQDLVLVFNPPIDDTGTYLTGQDYQFEIFYNAADGHQLNGEIDRAATFPTPPAGFSTNNFSYNVPAADLSLASDNTFTVTLPKDIFVDSVQTGSGAQAVGSYKIDIAAQKTGNAAIMLQFKKQ